MHAPGPDDEAGAAAGGLWIFGYGSLLWRPDFEHEEVHPARVRGWSRRFWQASPDHRGVPHAPGRVVTLVAEARAHCWGLAYRVRPDRGPSVLAALDVRESGGFVRTCVTVELQGAAGPVDGLTYVAAPDNPNFLGPAAPEAMLRQIRSARGASGSNAEYVVRLARCLRALGVSDPHVFELAGALEGTR